MTLRERVVAARAVAAEAIQYRSLERLDGRAA